ncbi:hypothetical protein Hanom_Chr16g01472321 [Helianthus anomalus]
MFIHLTKQTKFLVRVRVRLFNKRTNTNELLTERFTNYSPNVWFVCSPIHIHHMNKNIKKKHTINHKHQKHV